MRAPHANEARNVYLRRHGDRLSLPSDQGVARIKSHARSTKPLRRWRDSRSRFWLSERGMEMQPSIRWACGRGNMCELSDRLGAVDQLTWLKLRMTRPSLVEFLGQHRIRGLTAEFPQDL